MPTHRHNTAPVSLWMLLLAACQFAATAATDELPTLRQSEARHEWVHTQVAPAVVAVQSRGSSLGGMGLYGTGVVISPQGLILTSSIVVPNDTRAVEVYFPDGRVMEARVICTDEATETCALQAVRPNGDSRPLPFLELCDSSKVSPGQLAYTAGNPFHTISRDGQVAWSVGTISGIYPIKSADELSRYSGQILETDAAVNTGSDGGPLIDANGRLLGILSLCFCESRWLGTAIPVHLIKQSLAPMKPLPLFSPGAPREPQANEANALPARAVPEGLRIASRPACRALVQITVKRTGRELPADHRAAPARRLRQRPDAPVTGVLIDPRGFILTSAFNVEGALAGIEVRLHDGTLLPAALLGRHFGLDLALLKAEPPKNEQFAVLELCPGPDLRLGRFVSVLGASEAGPEPTRTQGIISALGRLDGLAVQTDALINYGNSGGPVIDLQGRLIGLATHVRTHSDWSQQNSGVGFFTQSDKILACLDDLKASRDLKAPSRPFLGIMPSEAPETRGVKLEQVVAGSAAASANLQTGDIIVAVDGMDTYSWPALVRVLKAHQPGDTVEIAFQRGTVISRAKTTLNARKDGR